MGLFTYNSPVITLMVRIANFILLSLYWVLCCLPVVTVLPACAALYHSVCRVIGGNSGGVTRAFFAAFRNALKPGVVLSIVLLVLCVFLTLGVYTGLKVWDVSLFGAIYMAAGILLSILCATMLVYVPPVLSRFEGRMGTVIHLSLYFSGRKLIKSIWFVVLLCMMAWAVDFFPLLLLVAPALYADLIRPGVEKELKRYIREQGLEDVSEGPQETAPISPEPMSQHQLDALLTQEDCHDAH